MGWGGGGLKMEILYDVSKFLKFNEFKDDGPESLLRHFHENFMLVRVTIEISKSIKKDRIRFLEGTFSKHVCIMSLFQLNIMGKISAIDFFSMLKIKR